MVGPIVLAAASAGLGALAGLATADRCCGGSGSWGNKQLPPLAGGGALGGPSCATCGGTGKVACCLCARWSDGDVGCRRCAGSGRTACRSCRGSGTGRRAPAQVVAVAVRARRPLAAVTKGAK